MCDGEETSALENLGHIWWGCVQLADIVGNVVKDEIRYFWDWMHSI
jgi:hypothetical protein